jgi:hypothetical protein
MTALKNSREREDGVHVGDIPLDDRKQGVGTAV